MGSTSDAFIDGKNADDILAIPKGSRPDPSSYLKPDFIKNHLSTFEEGGSYLVPKEALDKYGRELIGRPDGNQFVMNNSEMNNLLVKADGDLTVIETELGIPAGLWKNKELVRIDIPISKELNLRMPNGNEGGANELWLPGGKLPNGYREAVINQISIKHYSETIINIK